ncbi:MAG: carboxylate-amine ligase [Rhodospirillales bacterium]
MPFPEPSFTIGIEEEYLLVEPATRNLSPDPPQALIEECASQIKGLVKPEFFKPQIEVSTHVCNSITEARDNLKWLRGAVAHAAGKYGLAPIAASTHPFSEWRDHQHTDKERYNILAENMQGVARRLLICGMHVHVGIDDEDMRIDLMNQAVYFLPHLLALSTSSPFWRGQDTGLKSYRLSVFDELPRTGLPERFDSYGEYRRHVEVMVKANLIKDASMLWWDIRPSANFPTIEMRITDVCTLLDDALTIAALFLCIVRMLYRLRRENQRWRLYTHMLINENRWRAQRYGLDEGLVDFGKGEVVPCADLIEELLELIGEDAGALGCTLEVEGSRDILQRGTSSHRQLKAFNEAIAAGAAEPDALNAVVDQLIIETMEGIE